MIARPCKREPLSYHHRNLGRASCKPMTRYPSAVKFKNLSLSAVQTGLTRMMRKTLVSPLGSAHERRASAPSLALFRWFGERMSGCHNNSEQKTFRGIFLSYIIQIMTFIGGDTIKKRSGLPVPDIDNQMKFITSIRNRRK